MFNAGVPTRKINSKIRGPAKAVVLLGAGASAQVGGPLVREFIDLARDGLRHVEFSENEVKDIKESLTFYDNLKASFSLTEEDIDNIESLLAFADLSPMISTGKIHERFPQNISQRLRGLITTVLKSNIQLPSINSPDWVGLDKQLAIKSLIEALACSHDNVTIITLNYDCALEYASYCMGLPFTYIANNFEGAEILKLHGSLNWLHCSNEKCNKTWISPLEFCSTVDGHGCISLESVCCTICKNNGAPIIVPPTWSKSLDLPVLRNTWSRAVEVLESDDAFVAIGYSLPTGDQHVRNLLHLGFSSGRLRQGNVLVGNDSGAAERWESLFRPWWRNTKLKVIQSKFEDVLVQDLFAGLAIPDDQTRSTFAGVLPVIKNPFNSSQDENAILRAMDQCSVRHSNGLAGVDWSAVQKKLRKGTSPNNNPNVKVLYDCGHNWQPEGNILPVHGDTFPQG